MANKLLFTSKKTMIEVVQGLLDADITVLGPVAENDGFIFKKITDPAKMRLDYDRAFVSPIKEYLIPRSEVICEFSSGKYHSVGPKETETTVIFGVHPYDINALPVLDQIYAGGKYSDPNYMVRRRNMIIVGLDVTHPPTGSFAESVGAHITTDNFDLMLTDSQNGVYFVEIGTAEGQGLLSFAKGMVLVASSDHEKIRTILQKKVAEKYPVSLNTALCDIPSLLQSEKGKALLSEMAEKCIACGNCTKVCPTCVCYQINDVVLLDGKCSRERCRSSCLFAEAAETGGGHNFRPKAEDRITNRLLDKTSFISKEHRILGCVGCGRCGICPADIAHIANISNRLREETK